MGSVFTGATPVVYQMAAWPLTWYQCFFQESNHSENPDNLSTLHFPTCICGVE